MSPHRIRRLRRRLGQTQATFARRLGIAPNTVAGWEQGRHRPQKLMQRMLREMEGRVSACGSEYYEERKP